jgi:hypothetical protein
MAKRKSAEEKLSLYKANISWALKVMEPLHSDWKRYAQMYGRTSRSPRTRSPSTRSARS